MSLVLEVDPGDPDAVRGAAWEASHALLGGELVVFPTETVYGLAARPGEPGATARLYAAKRRLRSLNMPVLAPTSGAAWELARATEAAIGLAEAFWPGPLTLVMRRSPRSRGWELGERRDSIGVRVPDHRLAAAILGGAGPLATTSANLSGRPPLQDAEGLVAAFGDLVAVYVVLPEEAPPPGGTPSTVLDLTDRGGGYRVLRAGAVGLEAIQAVLGSGRTEPRREEPGQSVD